MIRPVLLILSLAVGGCATALTPSEQVAPLRLAFTEPVESLYARADRHEAEALYALSFLTLHGLRGVTADPTASATMRLEGRPRSTMITQYIPGVNGAPGRVSMIPANVGGWPFSTRVLDLCGEAVLNRNAPMGEVYCGDAGLHAELVALAGTGR
jgi:hypothetical protein